MERGSRILVFLALFAGLYFLFGTKNESSPQTRVVEQKLLVPEDRPVAQSCDIWTELYRAQISSWGGVLVSNEPLTAKYKQGGKSLQLVTTPDHPQIAPLFTSFASLADTERKEDWLVQTDIQNFEIEKADGHSCLLVYKDQRVRIEKLFRAGNTPYSIQLTTKITNLDQAPHRYALSTVAAAYLLDAKVESKMFRMNPLMSHVECFTSDGSVTRERPEDFTADSFDDAERFRQNSINPGYWSQPSGQASVVAVSNAYFTTAVSHDDGPAAPSCLLQVDHRFHRDRYKSAQDDPEAGAIYQARLAYEPRQLDPNKTDTFEFKAFIGPKERKALSAVGDQFDPIIDLGFFSVIAKVLVGYLLWLYDLVPSWGLSIVLLTVTTRTLLFPLTWPSVKNMVHMRELKPEMDRLNEKFKDDPQAKGLAQMELWKKHGVNPMKGCLPQLVSMPVWFALYTTLQSAVELYNIPFLWFPDLSEADPYYILPFVIGVVFFAQQKLMPMQADPAQQKMMLYFMPAMFTVFMLFLPAGLGVYMFTNSLLGIAQQQVVEHHAKKTLADRKSRALVSDTPQSKPQKNKRG